MENNTPILTADYLTTEYDYIYTDMAQLKYETKTLDRVIMTVLGLTAVFCGIFTLIFVGGGFIKNFCWVLLIVIGLFLVSYHDVINPSMTRSKAKKIYNANKDKFVSRNVMFYEDSVKILSDRYKGNIPYKCLYYVLEDKNVIILYFDKNDFISVPKRLFSEKDEKSLERLREIIGQKYKKIA